MFWLRNSLLPKIWVLGLELRAWNPNRPPCRVHLFLSILGHLRYIQEFPSDFISFTLYKKLLLRHFVLFLIWANTDGDTIVGKFFVSCHAYSIKFWQFQIILFKTLLLLFSSNFSYAQKYFNPFTRKNFLNLWSFWLKLFNFGVSHQKVSKRWKTRKIAVFRKKHFPRLNYFAKIILSPIMPKRWTKKLIENLFPLIRHLRTILSESPFYFQRGSKRVFWILGMN